MYKLQWNEPGSHMHGTWLIAAGHFSTSRDDGSSFNQKQAQDICARYRRLVKRPVIDNTNIIEPVCEDHSQRV